jgi:hypothetical protein
MNPNNGLGERGIHWTMLINAASAGTIGGMASQVFVSRNRWTADSGISSLWIFPSRRFNSLTLNLSRTGLLNDFAASRLAHRVLFNNSNRI